MCGEKHASRRQSIIGDGSPPRVRGEVYEVIEQAAEDGITPACAGRRCHGSAARGSGRDHPRVCGEKSARAAQRRRSPGSPPRVRGEEIRECSATTMRRITPACAGRSRVIGIQNNRYQDHPRVCGEKISVLLPAPFAAGSPPRVRGEGGRWPRNPHRTGITPACAGRRLTKISE